MSQSISETGDRWIGVWIGGGAVAAVLLGGALLLILPDSMGTGGGAAPRVFRQSGQMTIWWESLPNDVSELALPTGPESNIHPSDYAGPESCRECHADKYASWSGHAHRWMNALADESTVKGDFSGSASIRYLGGEATFEREGDRYLMRLRRGDVHRVYQADQTIGSRFFQYYVGHQIVGPEHPEHPTYRVDHVLPFGYWLDYKQWIPVVHVGPEMPDGQRPDPFHPPYGTRFVAEYANNCNYCHTTFPLAEMFVRNTPLLGRHAPVEMHWLLPAYLRDERPELVPSDSDLTGTTIQEMEALFYSIRDADAPSHAVTLGISCEACHLGAKQHAENAKILPKFFPKSPYLSVASNSGGIESGRTHENVNWICGRCHTGERPEFAGGIATWNSTEYTDATRGSCYSKLRCIDCHDPHQGIGKKWSRTNEEDDASCLRCHEQFEPAEARVAHTHHPMGSSGARCMNCHMPRMNEGLQDVVRTHTIFSPTKSEPIEANHPNACNLCHTDQSIDWTLKYLNQWYGVSYPQGAIAANYPDRGQPVAIGWLQSRHESVRLLAADALIRARNQDALPQLLDALDDPFLLNRQFAFRGLQQWLDIRLSDFGYQFYDAPHERRAAVDKIRAAVGSKEVPK